LANKIEPVIWPNAGGDTDALVCADLDGVPRHQDHVERPRRIQQRNQPHPASLRIQGRHQQEDYVSQSPQKPPEKSISDQAFQDMTDEQRRQEEQRRGQSKSTPPEDGTSRNNYPGTGSPS
jgi:hypothetical protein